MRLSDFDYHLPKELIAQYPLSKRHDSRLMVVSRDSKEIISSKFKNISQFFKPEDVFIINNTKVIPARLFAEHAKKSKNIEILLTRHLYNNYWEALVKGARHVKEGDILIMRESEIKAKVEKELEEGKRVLEFLYEGDFLPLLNNIGIVPLPPYIKREVEDSIDKERYQTLFASQPGSVAAPTGGLHFSSLTIDELNKMGIEMIEITLHIGPGTFRPIRTDEIELHEMEEEYYEIPQHSADQIIAAQKDGRRIIAVGTSTTRALEGWALKRMKDRDDLQGMTDLYIYPGFTFRIINGLVTNFHLPKSTLLLLVSAFAGHELIMKAYKKALKEKYRFYSYGDCMLIL